MQEINQMLTIAGGVIIAGVIAFAFSLGWTLTFDSRSAPWWLYFFRFFSGLLMLIATGVLSFWIVFIRTGVLSWHDLASLLPR
jgi:hypothetical protein